MEDLASEFKEDFLDAVKILEDFSSSDGALREALQAIRGRVESKAYSCAPNFWEDLKGSLGVVAHNRHESFGKSKAGQVLKQVARLEVKFWAKEALAGLQELDPEWRLERMVDWIQTFEGAESGDQSNGPAVLYQVLNDPSIQKDMEGHHRDALTAAVRDNLHKFPVSMQAMLERVGTVISSGGARGLSDWRRRNQPTRVQEEPTQGPGAQLLFGDMMSLAAMPGSVGLGGFDGLQAPAGGAPTMGAVPGRSLDEAADIGYAASADVGAGGGPVPSHCSAVVGVIAQLPQHAGNDDDDDVGGGVGTEQLSTVQADPELLARARRAVLAVLTANAGECKRSHVRTLLKQVGVVGLPIASLGEEIFFSGNDVFLRRQFAVLPNAAAPAPGKQPVPQDLQQRMVEAVREVGGRLPLAGLAKRLQWESGSQRHELHGPLKRALAQVPELFFEPQKVFTAELARSLVAGLVQESIANDIGQQPQDPGLSLAQSTAAAHYVADPFAELISTIQAWLQQGDGVLNQDAVLPLIKAMGFKTRAVINALAKEVYWAHPEATCEILLRTQSGAAQHPKPLPDVYLHKQVHQNILQQIKSMGAKAKLDKLAGALGWNMKSELRKTYGNLRLVLTGLREVFFDPNRLFSKRALDGLVEWPVNRDGRQGPASAAEDVPVARWTPAVDDMKAADDPAWLNAKRQIIGTVMRLGGRCDVAVIRQLLIAQAQQGQVLNDGESPAQVTFETLFEPDSNTDLSKVLYWSSTEVRCRRPEHVDKISGADDQVVPEVRRVIVDVVQAKGAVTLLELQAALENAGLGVEGELDAQAALLGVLPRMPELLFAPEVVFMRHVIDSFTMAPLAVQPEVAKTMVPVEPVSGMGEETIGGSSSSTATRVVQAASNAGGERALLALPAGGTGAADSPQDVDTVGPPGGSSTGFFSFSEFTAPLAPATEAPSPGTPTDPRPLAKKRRRELEVGGTPSAPAWADGDVPPWVTEGAAVTVRGEDGHERSMDGVIVRASASSCTVRFKEGEQTFPTQLLLPVAAKVGATVKVVAGDRSGCMGKLVGLAGLQAVVQIGKMSYETLPMSALAVLGV